MLGSIPEAWAHGGGQVGGESLIVVPFEQPTFLPLVNMLSAHDCNCIVQYWSPRTRRRLQKNLCNLQVHQVLDLILYFKLQ